MRLVRRSLIRKLVLLLAPMAAFFVSSPVPAQKQDASRHVTFEHNDGHLKRRLEIRGDVEFNEEYTDIKDISAGGFVRIEEVLDGQSRRYEVRGYRDKKLIRMFYLNREMREIDDAARAWVAQLVLDAVRQGALDADKRVQMIVSRRGVTGVLEEIELIINDYARGRYYEKLIKYGNLNPAALEQTVAHAAKYIRSDYEQSKFLIRVAPTLSGKDTAVPTFFQAVNSIDSDYEHRRVLSALLKTKKLSEVALTQLLNSASALSSDYEKATLLLEASSTYTGEARLRSAFLRAVETIKSDYERGRVLSALLKNKQIG